MPATRVTRGSVAAAEDFAALSSRDRLIFAQAVFEYGARQGAWPEIAKLLSRHPLISRPKIFFNAQSCALIYNYLMKEAELERTDECEGKKSAIHAQLAQRFFRDRIAELQDRIASEEGRFKTLVTEIEDIRAGKWDDKISAKLDGAEVSLDLPSSGPFRPGESADAEKLNGKDAFAEGEKVMEEPRMEPAPPSQLPESEGEVSMDVSSPMRPSSPPSEQEQEVPKLPEEHSAEVPATESDVNPVPRATEDEPSVSPKHVPRTRSRIRKDQPELEETSVEETGNIRMQSVEDKDEKQEAQEAEVEELAEVNQEELLRDETSPGVQQEEPDELISHESTPAPAERREGKRRASDVDMIDASRERKRQRERSEPLDIAESPAPATPSAISGGVPKDAKERKRFQSVILMLHQQITAHRNGTIFHHPIKPSEAPDYHDIVKRPMDLKTIKNRVKDGRISTSSEYQRDIYLMFANSLMYNRPNSDIYMMAEEMMLDSEAEIQNFQQTEAYNLRTRG